MVIVMFFGITFLISFSNVPTNHFLYLIPIYNSVQTMAILFAMQVDIISFVTIILTNRFYINIGVLAIAKMFDSKKMISNN